MRLLVLGYEYPPIGGGTAHSLKHLLETWSDCADWEIEVWTAAPPSGFLPAPVRNVRFEYIDCDKRDLHFWTAREQWKLLRKAWRRARTEGSKFDAVLIWGGWPLGLLLLGPLKNIPAVLSLRGSDVPGFNPRTSNILWKFAAKKVWRRAACLTANSPVLAALAKKTLPNADIKVIPNGVILPAEYDEATDSEKFRILCVSRLIPRKRIDWIIRAVAQLDGGLRKRVEVEIVGGGPLRTELANLGGSLGVVNRVHFLEEVPQEELPGIYHCASCFVLPSEAEGLSNALLEAMSYGLPCLVATRTGFEDIDEVVQRFETLEELATNLTELLRNTDSGFEAGQKGREVASHYSWQAVGRRYKELLGNDVEQ